MLGNGKGEVRGDIRACLGHLTRAALCVLVDSIFVLLREQMDILAFVQTIWSRPPTQPRRARPARAARVPGWLGRPKPRFFV
jgi:hypothetical protein